MSRAWVTGLVVAVILGAVERGQAEPEDDGGASEAAEMADAEAEGPWSEGVPQSRREAARARFLEGNVLMKDALFADAAARYWEAIAIWDHPAFHYNLALAQRNLDQPIEAYGSMERALRHGAAPLGRAKYAHGQRIRALYESQLARIEIECEPGGVAVALNGTPLFTSPGPYSELARPGRHQLVASKPGYVPESRQIELEAGKRTRVKLVLVPVGRMVEHRRWPTWKPWAVVASGAAAALAGGALHWQSARTFEGYDNDFEAQQCAQATPFPGCRQSALPQALQDRLTLASWEQRIAVTAYVAGGAVLAGGLVMLYLNQPRWVAAGRSGSLERASIVPVIGPNAAGVSAQIRF